MSALDLTVDGVDNAAAYGIDQTPKVSHKGITARLRSVFSSDKPLSRNVWAGGTGYTEGKVAAILRDFLQPDTKLSLHEAAGSLLALIPHNAAEHAEVCSFGGICVELAEQIPYHHPSQLKLTQLLRYISMSPKFMYKYPLTAQEELHQPFQLLWESLADSLDGPDVDNPAMWVNLNAFAANVYSTGVWGTSPGNALEMLRETFETEAPEEVWERDCNIMAAAQWILWHGQTLLKLVIFDQSENTSDTRHWRLGKAYAGPSMEPRSIERWRFWKAGFEAVHNAPDTSDECKNVARKAARVMASLEDGMLFSACGHQIASKLLSDEKLGLACSSGFHTAKAHK